MCLTRMTTHLFGPVEALEVVRNRGYMSLKMFLFVCLLALPYSLPSKRHLLILFFIFRTGLCAMQWFTNVSDLISSFSESLGSLGLRKHVGTQQESYLDQLEDAELGMSLRCLW